ncbi:MAG: YicC family protein [Rhizobiales bacterium]|nr:YicC family protein [Hyphomicrobiales bacterium]
MTITSMTGFARDSGSLGDWSWQWELKSVNGKALDVRLRLPPGLEHLDAEVRQRIQKVMKRGNLQVGLNLSNSNTRETVTVNQPLLAELTAIAGRLRAEINAPPLQAESLLALRGVLEPVRSEVSEEEAAARDRALMESFERALIALQAARAEEGKRLLAVLKEQLQKVAALAVAARDNPARAPDAIRRRLRDQVARLMETGASFDEQRLHQEAMMVATRSDIQEELDRLFSHVEAAGVLLAAGEPVGRKFDFLAQEFNREANTLCSKAIDKSLTAIGLDLKTVIDQMREQVQNIE